jgi:hypothetical protein
MDQRQRDALDNYITGHYGEDQFPGECTHPNADACEMAGEHVDGIENMNAPCDRYVPTPTQICNCCGRHRIDHAMAAGGIGHPPTIRIPVRLTWIDAMGSDPVIIDGQDDGEHVFVDADTLIRMADTAADFHNDDNIREAIRMTPRHANGLFDVTDIGGGRDVWMDR